MSDTVLVIDTSTDYGLVEFISEKGLLYRGAIPKGIRNSQYLIPRIEEGLEALHLELKDLKWIVVGVGPGSYTGIRVGVVTAETLAAFASLPLVGVSTLKAFGPEEEGEFAVVIDAKVSGAYLIKGERRGGFIRFEDEAQVVALKDFSKAVAAAVVLVTPDKSRLAPKLKELYPDHAWQWEEKEPSGLLMYAQSQGVEPATKVEILYLREGSAPQKRK